MTTDVYDSAGRWIAPAQHAPAERPVGPWNLNTAIERDNTCQNCGTALAMCLYWKINGYVACCPECKHGKQEKTT